MIGALTIKLSGTKAHLHKCICDEALGIQSITYLQHLAARDIVIQLENHLPVCALHAISKATLLVRSDQVSKDHPGLSLSLDNCLA